jgi:hypothetical protein
MAKDSTVFYSRLQSIIKLIFIIFICAIYYYGCSIAAYHDSPVGRFNARVTSIFAPSNTPRYNAVTTFTQPTPIPVLNDTRTPYQMIEDTLWIVARYIDNGRDMTGNGKSNCEDAAILFFMYYPIRENVQIYEAVPKPLM